MDMSGRDVVVVEVGPRDGLQNEAAPIPTATKVAFVDALTDSGLSIIETTSFVNPRLVPQLADAAEVMTGIRRSSEVRYPVLVPNERGLLRALQAGVDAIALFTAATDEFAHANVGTSVAGTFERFAPVVETARGLGMWIRGYVSVAFVCPYAGDVESGSAADVALRLLELGCDEICLADTVGQATPKDVQDVLVTVEPVIPVERLALHFHDTSEHAIANVERALEHGVRVFDASAGGLGGCPFAPGAPGNLSTERLLERLHGLGLRTGVSVEGVAQAVELLRDFVPRLKAVSR
jgi:hydroxymethylglutaryl-CoA lyase